MISRQRLKELIKNADENSIIWGVTDYTYHKSKPNLRFEYFELLNMPSFYKNNIDKLFETYNNTEFFETKEEAELALRYKRIPRTEYLDLPTWEEFTKERDMEEFGFYSKYHKYTTLKVISDKYLAVEDNWKRFYTGELTKENYLEVCELCRKLWLGEEV